MKYEVSTVKGFQDYLPPESLKRKKIVDTIEKYFQLYGFLPIETPIIEFEELMSGDFINEEEQDEAVAERFRLKDRGNRSLGLRYEFTFQLARILKENPNIKLPFKRYQIGPVFRDEPIRQGRTRQFTQCDADIIGDDSVNADAECIALISDIFKELKIETEIQINNRKLLNAIIESVQIEMSKQVLREIDKIEKIGVDQVKANLRRFASSNQIITLFKLFEKNIEFFKENAFDGAKELEQLMKLCRLYGIQTKFTPSMVRGFSYYTGNIFEIIVPGKKVVLSAGGRYDKLVGKYINRNIPAVGISFSLEALMGLCEEQISKIKIEKSPKALLIPIEKEKEAIYLARKLRKNDISCSIANEKPGKALEYANALEIPYAVFIGNEEIKKEKFKLKDMKSGEEKLLSEKQLISKLKIKLT